MSKQARAQASKAELSHPESGLQITRTVASSEYFEGVLPPPEMLAQYEALEPGLIRWMMNRVESQQGHRMQLESFVVTERTKQGTRGQIFAFLLGLGTLVVAAIGFWLSQPLAGFGSVVVGIGAIGSAYYVGQRREAKERQEKDEQLHGKPKAIDPPKRKRNTPNS